MLTENLRKAIIYLNNDQSWWLPAKPAADLALQIGPLKPYPVDLTPRLDDGHFAVKDDKGIPQKDFGGTIGRVYNITRVCGYALANCDRYMHTAKDENAEIFIKCAKWLRDNADVSATHGLVVRYRYPYKTLKPGRISGLAQGQLLSVFTRAYFLTGDSQWKSLAGLTTKVFLLPVEEGGVRALFEPTNVDWYEEDPDTKCHILNGQIYALIGLREAAVHLELSDLKQLYDYGLNALTKSLQFFDCGYWSYYSYPKNQPLYVASYSYHWMHCILLKHLSELHPDIEVLEQFAHRWHQYCDKRRFRLRAGLRMGWQKMRRYSYGRIFVGNLI